MAELRVEPKRSSLGWLWAIILLVLLALGAWYFFANSQPATVTSPADSTRTSLIDTPTGETPASDLAREASHG